MLPRFQDAYGLAMYDFHLGRGGDVCIERDDGYMDTDVAMGTYFSKYAQWPAYLRKAVDLAEGRVLDIGCGAGRHALHCQKKGFRVTAIDQSPFAVKTCRARGVKHAKVQSITTVSAKTGRFSTLLMLGNNLGLFGSYERARWLLRRFKAMTTPDARILAESTDPYGTDHPYHLDYHGLNRSRGRMSGQLRIRVRYRTHATPWFDYLLASRDEVRELVDGTGWHVERFIHPTGDRYVAVLKKN